MRKLSFVIMFLFLVFACENKAVAPTKVEDAGDGGAKLEPGAAQAEKMEPKKDNSRESNSTPQNSGGSANNTASNSGGNSANITPPPQQVERISVDMLQVGLVKLSSRKIHAKALPENAVNATLTYTSQNPNIATVSGEGVISAKEVGQTRITIKAANGVSAQVSVEVTEIPVPVEDIEIPANLDGSILRIGESVSLCVSVKPHNATDPLLRYEVSDADKISVSEYGFVTPISAGEASVTITVPSVPSISKTVNFTIKPQPELKLEQKEIEITSEDELTTFDVTTLYGKSEYEVQVKGEGAKWLSLEGIDLVSHDEKDVVSLKAKKNKTVWDRVAYVEIKKNIKKIESIKIVQKANPNPVISLEWVSGIGEPSPEEKTKIEVCNGAKKFYWEDDKIFHWKESLSTKWFNNRKLFAVESSAPGGDDRSQCWAKTASNMLHWWFENNKDNITRYIEKNSIEGEKEEEYQHFYNREFSDGQEGEKSFIAKKFRVYARNDNLGNYIERGLAWYLYGGSGVSKNASYKGPALFKDVFDIYNSPIKVNVIQNDIALFNRTILGALRSKKAVGLVISGTKGGKGYQHAITLWGAAYDEEENIVAIYVVDNNYGDNKIFPYGIYYMEGKPYLFNYGVNEFVKDRYVGEVVTLDLGQEYFDRYFQ